MKWNSITRPSGRCCKARSTRRCTRSPNNGRPAPIRGPSGGRRTGKTTRFPPSFLRSAISYRRGVILVLAATFIGCAAPRPVPEDENPPWERLPTEPARDRQDDISFIDSERGWYVNSLGKIFKTENGGRTWTLQTHKPGTYWRSILFIDERRGFAGNLGPGAIEGLRGVMEAGEFESLNRDVRVDDPELIYETTDGGRTWKPSSVPGSGGICSISSVGTTVFAGGRVTGPSALFRWTEPRGWESLRLPEGCGMVLDVVFLDARTGIVCAATASGPAWASASIFRTEDGGLTWTEVYRSKRPGETVWKCSFPTRDVGYATIRSFSTDRGVTERFVVKTVDGGRTWKDVLVVDDYDSRPQAVCFLTPDRGWVGTTTQGFETRDGGGSWTRVDLGRSINRIRIVKHPGGGHVLYAIGQDLCKLRLR